MNKLSAQDFCLRKMKEQDIPLVLEIEKLCFPNPWPESAFRGELENPGISFPFVIIHSHTKNIIGYIIYWHIQKEVQISNIAIHPDFRRLGIGEFAIKMVLDKAQEQDVEYLFLEVRPSNLPAVRLYEKLGFQKLGLRKKYYYDPQEDAIIMGKSLVGSKWK